MRSGEKKGEAQRHMEHPSLVLLRYTAAMATGDEQFSIPKNLAETNLSPLSYT